VTEPEEDNNKETTQISLPTEEGGFIEGVMRALELTHGIEIARRYLAMNAFDGALTMLGLILGGLISMASGLEPELVFNTTLLAAVGTSLAMAISGFSGSYLTETAERDREVEEMGKAMLSDMSDTIYARATRTTSIVVAIVDGLAPTGAALIIITPLILVHFEILNYIISFYLAIAVCMFLLFLLGLFLGSISGKSMWRFGAKTLLAGILTAILMFIISLITDTGV
jgi:predicted membrane protein (TIGR00267 family)